MLRKQRVAQEYLYCLITIADNESIVDELQLYNLIQEPTESIIDPPSLRPSLRGTPSTRQVIEGTSILALTCNKESREILALTCDKEFRDEILALTREGQQSSLYYVHRYSVIDSCLEDQHTQLEPITNYTLLRKTQQQHLTNELAPFYYRTLPISHFSPSYKTRNIWLPNDESWCSSILMTSYHKGEETRHIFHSYSIKHGLTGLSISQTNLPYHLLSAGSAPTQNLPYTFLLHFSSHVTQLHHLFLLLTK